VLLDSKRNIARVVFPQGTVDFAQQDGESLLTDLHRRDFTINAIAYNPYTQELMDPLGGCKDIESGLLRMISPQNLQDDPLRLMRAYRQAAQLNFVIEPHTQVTIRKLSGNLCQVASERVRTEVGHLLQSAVGTFWLKTAWEDGLLGQFFIYATRESVDKLIAVDPAVQAIGENWLQLGEQLEKPIRDSMKTRWLDIAKLGCLVNPAPEIAERELGEMTYSRVEIRSVITALRLFPQMKQASSMSLREQYYWFREVGVVFSSTIVLALVQDMLNTKFQKHSLELYRPLVERYLNPDDLVAHPSPLVTGKEVIVALNIPPSPLVGDILQEIAIAQAEGKVNDSQGALALARKLI
jgi:tRNA nucleotidyltransferase (CCA-adding enzyme)